MTAPSPSLQDDPSPIPGGALIGGRFLVERFHGEDALGMTLLARDQKTSKAIGVRLLGPALTGGGGVPDVLKSDVRLAAKLKHRSILGTYGIGTHDGHAFVACEWVQGSTLADQVRRRRGGVPLSVRGIYNVVAHVCKALAQVHETTSHGALRPAVVWVSRSGRVKIGELGFGSALIQSGAFRVLDTDSQACLAPEVRAGQPPTVASDVYGVGALLYSMLTGSAPSANPLPPSRVHADATPELDAVVMRCLADDPAERYAAVGDITHALMPLVAASPEPDGDEFGVDVEIDVDIATSLAPPRPAAWQSAPQSSPGLPAAVRAPSAPRLDPFAAAARGSSPNVPARAASSPGMAPVVPRPRVPTPAPVPQAPPPPTVEEELASAMDKLTANDAPRWMAVKGGLDHGPFTAVELMKLIVDGEILAEHGLFNMSTNERKPVGEWSELRPFIEQYKVRKDEADHVVALEKSSTVERRSNVAKFFFLGGALLLVLVAGGGYLMNRQAAKKRLQQQFDLAEMYESGKVKITGTAGILQAPPRRAGGGGPRRSGGGAGPGAQGGGASGFDSYEDAMNQAMDIGDANGGGERQLRVDDIQGVMDRKLSGGRLGRVQLDIAIVGSGQVLGASVSAGSGSFKSCIVGKLRQIHFPSFPAPRMGARYSFNVD
jgi:serine/threonine protein kinase